MAATCTWLWTYSGAHNSTDWDLQPALGHHQQELGPGTAPRSHHTCLSMALVESKNKNPKEKCSFAKHVQHNLQHWTSLLWPLPHNVSLSKTTGALKQVLTNRRLPQPSFISRIQLLPMPLLPELSGQVKSITMSLKDFLGTVLCITL